MDKILNAASDIMAATNVELSLKGKAKENVIKILKELMEEKFKSTNTGSPKLTCAECRSEQITNMLFDSEYKFCPNCGR